MEHKPFLVERNPRTNARHRNICQYSAKGKGDTSLFIHFAISLTLSAWGLINLPVASATVPMLLDKPSRNLPTATATVLEL